MREIGKKTQFRGGSAAEGGTGAIAGEKGNASQKVLATWKDTFRQRLTPKDMQKACDAVIEKMKAGDLDAFKLVRDTMGEKPKDALEINDGEPFSVTIRVIE